MYHAHSVSKGANKKVARQATFLLVHIFILIVLCRASQHSLPEAEQCLIYQENIMLSLLQEKPDDHISPAAV